MVTKNPPPGVILAGGKSSRMGQDKANVMLGGISLLDRVAARFAPQTNGVAVNGFGGPLLLPVIEDTVPGQAGPLAGILCALRYAKRIGAHHTHVATVPVDAPFLPSDLVLRLAAPLTAPDQIAVAVSGEHMHPVFGLWPLSLADDLELFLQRDDKRRVRSFVACHVASLVDFPLVDTAFGVFDPFFNINTPADLERGQTWLQRISN